MIECQRAAHERVRTPSGFRRTQRCRLPLHLAHDKLARRCRRHLLPAFSLPVCSRSTDERTDGQSHHRKPRSGSWCPNVTYGNVELCESLGLVNTTPSVAYSPRRFARRFGFGMNTLDLVGPSAPSPLAKWVPPVGGPLAAGVACLMCRLPPPHLASCCSLIGSTAERVLAAFLASAATVWGLCAILLHATAVNARRLVLRTFPRRALARSSRPLHS